MATRTLSRESFLLRLDWRSSPRSPRRSLFLGIAALGLDAVFDRSGSGRPGCSPGDVLRGSDETF